MSKSILHTADSRGMTNLGWLHSRHTFSFGEYYDPKRIHFGALRVINDDMVAPGKGFGTHPHSNMEIISIPLEGDLEHKDSMNNTSVIRKGEIQVMSAGTGIFHSEYNKNRDKSVRFLQIWIVPKVHGVKPRYDQMSFNQKMNDFTEILSPGLHDQSVWIFQDVWFNLGNLSAESTMEYKLRKPVTNGIYVFVLNGEINVNGQMLKTRDGFGLWETNNILFKAESDCDFLVIEVPMNL